MQPVHAQTPKYEKVLETYSHKDRYESGKGRKGEGNLPCGGQHNPGEVDQTVTVKNSSGGLFQQHVLVKWALFSREVSDRWAL